MMKNTARALAAAAMLLAGLTAAGAMSRSGAAQKFSIPWGATAGTSYITYPVPTLSQIGIVNCRASLTDGFPPLTFTPAAGGGCPPFGQDFNGILKQITQWNQWTQAGAIVPYDSAYSASIGGYPESAILSQAATPYCFWISQVDNNASDPDTGGSNWSSDCPGGGSGITTAEIGGNPNQQAVVSTPFALTRNAQLCFQAAATNTSSLQIQVNGGALNNVVQRAINGGLTPLVGQEVILDTFYCMTWDGLEWELNTPSSAASLVLQDQPLSGGAIVTSLSLGSFSTGTLSVDCGKRPLQYLTDAGTFVIAAPTNDGSCVLQLTNAAGAQVPTFSGFSVNPSYVGAPLDNTNGHKFMISILRVNGSSIYNVVPQQ